MEEKDIIGSILPTINIEKINVSNPTKEKLSIGIRYSFYDSLKQQNTLWSSLPENFKKSIKIVVGVLEDGFNLKTALLSFTDIISSEQLKFFHSSLRGEIKSIENFKRSIDQNNKEDITVEVINGIEYRKYVAETKVEIDITNNINLNLQAVAYCFFDSTEFDGILIKEKVKKFEKKQKKFPFFAKTVDYCGKFTYINIFSDNILKPEKLTFLNFLTKEEFLGQAKLVSRDLRQIVDFDTGLIELEEFFIPIDFVEDMRNYKFIKKNLKNILNEINALSYKFKNVNNKLVTVTNERQYFSQIFISKKLLLENDLPVIEEPLEEQPERFNAALSEKMTYTGVFFFDYERFVKEKSILNRIKESTIFIDPRFLEFKITLKKKNASKKEYGQIIVPKYSADQVFFAVGKKEINLLKVSFELEEKISEGEYFISVEVFLQDNIVQQLLQNLRKLKVFLNYLETYSSVVFKNLDKLSNSVKTNSTQPFFYYVTLEENYSDFVKAISDIGINLEDPIISEDLNENEKTGRKILEELLISLRPENTNVETVYQFIDLVGSIIKEYSKFTDIFSNLTFNPHVENFYNISRSRATVVYKHTFKETIKNSFKEKTFVLTKNEILSEKYNSTLFFDYQKSYFMNSDDFLEIVESENLEERLRRVEGANKILFKDRFDRFLKEIYPNQQQEEMSIEYLGKEQKKERENGELKNRRESIAGSFKRQEEKLRQKERSNQEEYERSLEMEEEERREREIYEENARNKAKSREANIINFIYNVTRRPEYLVGFSISEDPTYGRIINLGKPYWNSSKTNDNLQFARLVNIETKKDFFKDFKYSFIISDYNIKFTNEYFITN